MAAASCRFGLDASSHQTAAIACAGLAVGAGLCFLATALPSTARVDPKFGPSGRPVDLDR